MQSSKNITGRVVQGHMQWVALNSNELWLGSANLANKVLAWVVLIAQLEPLLSKVVEVLAASEYILSTDCLVHFSIAFVGGQVQFRHHKHFHTYILRLWVPVENTEKNEMSVSSSMAACVVPLLRLLWHFLSSPWSLRKTSSVSRSSFGTINNF